VTIVPAAWLCLCTITAGLLKLFSGDVKVGFLAHADKFGDAAARGQILAPAKTMAEMHRIVFNDRIDAALIALFLVVVVSILGFGIRTCLVALRTERPTVSEVPPQLVAAE